MTANATSETKPSSMRYGLSWSLIGGLGAGGLLFAQNLIAGRLLGPTEYGAFSLVQAITMVLLIPALAGFDLSTSRALSRSGDATHRAQLAASSIAVVLLLSLVSAAVVLAFSAPLAALLHTSQEVLVYATIFTVLLAQRWLMERQLSGLGRFRQQAGIRLAEAVTTVATFSSLVLIANIDDFRAIVLAYIAGAVVFIASAHLRDGVRLRPSFVTRASLRELRRYSTLMNANYMFATILFQMDTFVVNRVLGPSQLGLYTAYYTATIFVVAQLLMIISNVLYPAMSRQADKTAFLDRLRRLIPLAFSVAFVGLLVMLAIVLAIFGDSFPFRWPLALVFCGWASLYACNGTYAIVVNAHGERSAAREVLFQPVRIVFLLFWFSGWLLSPVSFTLEIAVSGLVIAELLEAANLRRLVATYVRLSHGGEPAHSPS